MYGGFDGASLAVFTGLTPSGAVAFACLAFFLLFDRSPDRQARARIGRMTAIPLAVAWAGLVASATHLGTPANALYAVTGAGTSPLSNEVVSVIAFLFFSGVYWLYSFAQEPRAVLERALLVAGAMAACAALVFTSLAYAVPTVPSWDTWLVPANTVLGALVAGPSLAVLVVDLARRETRVRWALLGVSALALALGTVSLVLYAEYLGGVGNHVLSEGFAVASYRWAIPLHGALSLAGLALQLVAVRVRGRFLSALGCLLVLAAAVIIRFPFYEAYISVGF